VLAVCRRSKGLFAPCQPKPAMGAAGIIPAMGGK
jgi:hypothetical protein